MLVYTYNVLGTETAPIRWNGPYTFTFVKPAFSFLPTNTDVISKHTGLQERAKEVCRRSDSGLIFSGKKITVNVIKQNVINTWMIKILFANANHGPVLR